MSQEKTLSGENIVVLAAAFSIMISKSFCKEDLGTLGNFFNAIGDNLSIIASRQDDPGIPLFAAKGLPDGLQEQPKDAAKI